MAASHRLGVHKKAPPFSSVFDAASSDGTSDSESEQHTAIAPLSETPPVGPPSIPPQLRCAGEMAEQQEVIEPPAKRARVPDLDTGVNAMLGEILRHELPPLDDGSLDGSLDVLRHEPPSLSTDLDFFLTNLETEIESTPSASPSVSPPLPLQPPPAKRKSGGGGGGGGGGSRKDWEPWEDEAIRNFVESKGPKWRKIAAMLPGRSDDAVRNRWVRVQGGGRAANSGGVGADAAVGAAAAAARAPAEPEARAAPELDGRGGRDHLAVGGRGGQPVEPHRDAAAQPHRARDPQPVAPPPADGGGRRRRCRRRRVYRGRALLRSRVAPQHLLVQV